MEASTQFEFSVAADLKGWIPVVGNETNCLLESCYPKISLENIQTLLDETGSVLSKCRNPKLGTGSEIGLVFGYVQSGKTMSFTTLTALAKDNGFQIVIIIAGISTNLVDQNYSRLEVDLKINERTDLQWLSFKNLKSSEAANVLQVRKSLEEWTDPTFPPEERRSILITVMKQKDHLPNLTSILEQLDLKNVPVLIIDDEADQHGLNNRASSNRRKGLSESSRIFESINNLRRSVPCHSFVQYTATPQAPLFIDIMNQLSPNFVQLLSPGTGYCGGRMFFEMKRDELIRVIDDIEDLESTTEPPDSLMFAMSIFFLGVVVGTKNKVGGKRSMMIHPSRRTYSHEEFFRFVNSITERWQEVLALDDEDGDKVDLKVEFRKAYEDLAITNPDIPSFESLWGDQLRHAIRRTVVQSMNSVGGNSTLVNWKLNYSFILIGGQAMDRGFTVEGLTVTYMPRSLGVGNADTIQQRARFFGYKSRYLGYCRVFIDEDALEAYCNYVSHEEDMRRQLRIHSGSGLHLDQWYRQVFLSNGLNLSRGSVFEQSFERFISEDWLVVNFPHRSSAYAKNNLENYQNWKSSSWKPSGKDEILAGEVSLLNIFVDLLSRMRFSNSQDALKFDSLLYLLRDYLDQYPEESCTVMQFGSESTPRSRGLDRSGKIKQLFQGANSKDGGDRMKRGENVSFQFHFLNLVNEDGVLVSGPVLGFACFIPDDLKRDIIRWSSLE